MLEREAGPTGWVEIGGQRHAIDGWELFEGDESNPHMCRGWFRHEAGTLTDRAGTTVHLHLQDESGETRELTARLEKARTTVPEWEFRADR